MNTFSETDLASAESIIGALDSRLRVQIIARLSTRDHFVHELVTGLGKSQPLISQHLRVLKRAGIVDSQRRGREVIYRLVLPQASELIDAAVSLGRHARSRQEARFPAEVIPIGRNDQPRGTGTEEDSVGQVAQAPAAASGPDVTADTIPDPAPTPPVPASFT